MSKNFIDVSMANGIIDWDKLAANKDIAFVVIRGLQGVFTDSKFERNIKECERVGIPFGLYFASSADTVEEAQAEADAAVAIAKVHPPRCGMWYDMELAVSAKTGKAGVSAMIKAWIDRVISFKYTAGIYTNLQWVKNNIDKALWTEYWFWFSIPPSTNPKTLADAPQTRDWISKYPEADAWQWSCDGRVDGIVGRVDLNICYTDQFPEPLPAPIVTPKKEYLTLADVKAMGYKGFIFE